MKIHLNGNLQLNYLFLLIKPKMPDLTMPDLLSMCNVVNFSKKTGLRLPVDILSEILKIYDFTGTMHKIVNENPDYLYGFRNYPDFEEYLFRVYHTNALRLGLSAFVEQNFRPWYRQHIAPHMHCTIKGRPEYKVIWSIKVQMSKKNKSGVYEPFVHLIPLYSYSPYDYKLRLSILKDVLNLLLSGNSIDQYVKTILYKHPMCFCRHICKLSRHVCYRDFGESRTYNTSASFDCPRISQDGAIHIGSDPIECVMYNSERMQYVRDYHIYDNRYINPAAYQRFLDKDPNNHYRFYNYQCTSLAGIENLLKLNSLHIENNQLTSLAGIESLIKLTSFHIENSQLTSPTGLNTRSQTISKSYIIDQLSRAEPANTRNCTQDLLKMQNAGRQQAKMERLHSKKKYN
jgi:hypothetical protein